MLHSGMKNLSPDFNVLWKFIHLSRNFVSVDRIDSAEDSFILGKISPVFISSSYFSITLKPLLPIELALFEYLFNLDFLLT